MRILCVNQDPGIGPAREKGAAVHLEEMRSAFRELGAEVVEIDCSDPLELRRRLEKQARAGPVHLVYERYALGAFAAGGFARERGLPHVLEVNAPLREEAQRHRASVYDPPDARAEREMFEGADLVLAVSTSVAAYARERGALAERIAVHANGVDCTRFRPLPSVDRSRLRGELGLGERFVLGFHGRLRPWHNLELLARATRSLLEADVDAHVLAIGGGEFESILGAALPSGRWSVLGWTGRERIAGLVACFDVLPLTYEPAEGFYFSPLKLLEAMACEVVPVVPDLGDLATIVHHARDGLVYPPGDLQALEAVLQAVAREPASRARLGRAARSTATSHTWTAIAGSILEQISPGR